MIYDIELVKTDFEGSPVVIGRANISGYFVVEFKGSHTLHSEVDLFNVLVFLKTHDLSELDKMWTGNTLKDQLGL